MKVNSNTVSITKESSEYQVIEGIIKKIASENEIDSVESVRISLSAEKGIVGFKIAMDWGIPTKKEDIEGIGGQKELQRSDLIDELISRLDQLQKSQAEPTEILNKIKEYIDEYESEYKEPELYNVEDVDISESKGGKYL